MPSVQPDTVGNRLLTALPPRILAHLLPKLRRVEMPFRSTLITSGKPVTTVYFPESGWVSMLVLLDEEAEAEVGLVGSEGLVGLGAVLGVDRSMMNGLVQAPGLALALDVVVLQQAMEELPPLRRLLLRYAVAFNTQVAVTAGCNVHHPLKKRLARWLLMSHDRADSDEFPMTHEFLSLMLGVRRAGVSVAAAELRKAGLIEYRQGRVHVLDRPGLERASCGCHRLVRQEADQLLRPTKE